MGYSAETSPPNRSRRDAVEAGARPSDECRGSTLNDPAARCGRCDGGGPVRTDRGPRTFGSEGSQPHLVLVLGIIVTVAIGLDAGLVWAFVGGLALDVLGTTTTRLDRVRAPALRGRGVRPRTALLAGSAARSRSSPPSFLSLVYSMALFALFSALRAPLPVADPLSVSCRQPSYDTCWRRSSGRWRSSIHDHRVQVERVDW